MPQNILCLITIRWHILSFPNLKFTCKTTPRFNHNNPDLPKPSFKLHSILNAQWEDGVVRVPALIWTHHFREAHLRRNYSHNNKQRNALHNLSFGNRVLLKSATFSIRQSTAKNHKVSVGLISI